MRGMLRFFDEQKDAIKAALVADLGRVLMGKIFVIKLILFRVYEGSWCSFKYSKFSIIRPGNSRLLEFEK